MARRLHYQTEEPVTPDELELLKRIKEDYNVMHRLSSRRIRLWRKSDILECLEPRDAVWGFTTVRDDGESVVRTIKEMSRAAPRLTWILYDEGSNGGREAVIKNGEIVHQ